LSFEKKAGFKAGSM